MGELNRRVHVLLDDQRLERLRRCAQVRGSSVGSVVRDAIDRELDRGPDPAAMAALESFLAAPPLPVGEPDELDRELDEWWDEEID